MGESLMILRPITKHIIPMVIPVDPAGVVDQLMGLHLLLERMSELIPKSIIQENVYEAAWHCYHLGNALDIQFRPEAYEVGEAE